MKKSQQKTIIFIDVHVGHRWIVKTKTGGDVGEGTGSVVVLVLYGEKGHSQPLLIGGEVDRQFVSGGSDTFNVRT